jgi:serine protease
VTAIALTGTPGLAGWYRSPVVVTLSPSDGTGSGIALIQYSLNNGPWQTYTAPFTVSGQGTTHVSARSTDLAGNVEVPAPPTPIRIDTGLPVVAIASPQAREYLFSDTITISVSVSDAISGISAPAALTLDGVPFSGSTIDLSSLALGPHTMTATVVDVAGNSSQASVMFRVVSVIDTVIHVPAEMPTIQGAINVAVNGDTVLVSPGTYHETINFLGKAITVTSEGGPAQTVIDARGQGTVVTFRSGETRAAALSGFTIRGGLSTHFGGGISILSSSPTVRGNVVTENRSCTGVGIYSSFGSPLIENNRITRNTIQGCTGGWGIGVYIGGNSAAQVIGNEISENTGAASSGGGVALFAAGSAVVRANVIARNATSGPAGCGWGGGIMTANFSAAQIVDNVIVGNSACFGGGIHWGGSTGSNVFVNNTVADNVASIAWPGVYVSGFDARNQLHNNIFAASSGPALYCENAASLSSPVMNANDVFSGQGPAYGGTCADQTGLNGNISADPQFINATAGNFRVRMSSAVIDAGNDSAPQLPPTDVAGHPRVVDGNTDGAARVDIGAFEYRNRAPLANAGQDQTVTAAADCLALVTLSGSGSDPDGDALTFRWSGSFGTVSGATATVPLSAGTHAITLTVDDGNGGTASDMVVVTVIDTVPPVISAVTATPSVVGLNNHEMVPVVVTVSASNGCDGAVTCRIVSVTSNEPIDGTGDGDTSPDWEITGSLWLNLRAERAGMGTGRVYTITVQCTDPSGNSTTSTVTVSVPR